MNPKQMKWRSPFLLGICIFLTALLWVYWVPALWAQQQPGIMVYPPQYNYPPSGVGPAPAPYLGVPTYNPNAPAYLQYPAQSAYFQGMMIPPNSIQPGASPLYGPQQGFPARMRSCQYSSPMVPSSPPQVAPGNPQAIPEIERPWPRAIGNMPAPQGVVGSSLIDPSVLAMLPASLRSQVLEGNLLPEIKREMQDQISPTLSPSSQGSTERKANIPKNDTRSPQSPQFPAPEPYSSIEATFNVNVFAGNPAPQLRQFGYSLFGSPASTFAPVLDVPVGPDYILGPGDSLQVHVYGSTQLSFVQNVDRNGEINLPSAGPVRLWGLTFNDAGDLIRRHRSKSFRGIKTSVTMGRLRTIRVFVVGEVCQPGSYTLSSLSTLTNALFAAGGPVKMGSLRNIQLKRNHHTVGTTDLYEFLLSGEKTRDFRLHSGDTIFFPPVGPVAAITGEVKRPAIYELSGSTSINDIIAMAGGKTPRSFLKRVQVIRSNPNVGREVIDLDLTGPQNNGTSSDIALRSGDLVTVYATDPRIYNTVRLRGAVKHPGEYQFKSGMRLSQLIQRDGVLPEAYVGRVEIARLKDDLTTNILEVSLKDAWAGDEDQDIALKALDQITVRSEYREAWTVRLSGEVRRPGTFTITQGERLSSVIKRAGGYTEDAFLKGAVFSRMSVMESEKKMMKEFLRDQEQRLLADTSQLSQSALGTSLNSREANVKMAVLKQRQELLVVLASKITLGRVIIRLDEVEKLEGTTNDLVLQHGDSINIPPKPSTVMVIGSVRRSTAIIHEEEEDLQYYLNRAGGLTEEAAEDQIYLLKGDGSALAGFVKLRNIDPGDVIVVPPTTEAKIEWLSLLRDLTGIIGQMGGAVIGVAGLAAIF